VYKVELRLIEVCGGCEHVTDLVVISEGLNLLDARTLFSAHCEDHNRQTINHNLVSAVTFAMRNENATFRVTENELLFNAAETLLYKITEVVGFPPDRHLHGSSWLYSYEIED